MANDSDTTAARPDSALTLPQKGSYAIGDVADGIQGAVVNTFLLFYLTTICGMPGSLAGLALAITLAIEAGTTPLFGYASDNTRTRWGRRHPYMLLASLPLAVSIGLIFSAPAFVSEWALFVYVLVVLIVLRGSFSAFALPYAALGAELSTDYRERAVIMAYRNAFNIAGTLLCYVLAFGVFLATPQGEVASRASYAAFGWTCGLLVLISASTACFGSLRLRHRLQQNDATGMPSLTRVARELRDVFRNPSFTVLFVMVVIASVAQGITESLSLHALRYFWEASSETTNRVFVVRVVGMACAIPLYTALLHRLEKRTILIAAIVVGYAVQLALPLFAIADLLPDSGPGLNALLYASSFINGALLTFLFISFGSMAADAADEHDLRFGVRREGLYFAGLIFFGKCALGVGTLLAGLALDVIGFPSDIAVNPTRDIAPDIIARLGWVYGPIAATIGLIAAATLLPYKLDRIAHARIRATLARRTRRDGDDVDDLGDVGQHGSSSD